MPSSRGILPAPTIRVCRYCTHSHRSTTLQAQSQNRTQHATTRPHLTYTPVPRPQHASRRSLHSTARLQIKPKTNALKLLPKNTTTPPPRYPYAPKYPWYKQAQTGLYGGLRIQFGNTIGPKSGVKDRRHWLPNVQTKGVYSRALDRMVRVKVTTRVLRTIDKVGGLDEYLLGGTPARLKELGEQGWRLRWAVLQSPGLQERVKREPRLRMLLEAKELPEPVVEEVVKEEVRAKDDVDVIETKEEIVVDPLEEGLKMRLEERLAAARGHMDEQQPPSLWGRVSGMFSRR